jgi:glycosyltransferase involved in cell wall biosynthesis
MNLRQAMNELENLKVETTRRKYYFTSINLEYLDKAITLWESLQIFETNAQFITVIVEPGLTKFQLEEQLKIRNFPFELSEPLLAHDIPWNWIEKMEGLSVVEACTAIKASAAKFLLASSLNTQVVYLDPDMQVYGSLSEVDQLLDESSFVLTPHLLEPPSHEESVVVNEIAGAMIHGVYNLGFFAVKNTREGFEILNWWESRLKKYCKAETGRGLFTDQKWFDIATIYFKDISVLRHPGYNVASWNLSERFLTNQNGLIYVDNFPLRIFHFSSFDSNIHVEMLIKFDPSNIALKLNGDYKQALKKNSHYKQSKIGSVNKQKAKRSVTRLLKNLSIKAIKFFIAMLIKNRITLKLFRRIPRQIRSVIFNVISIYINKNLERPKRFTEFNEKILIPPKWIIVTHSDGGGAAQIFRSISKFLNINNSSDGLIVMPQPEWAHIRFINSISNFFNIKNSSDRSAILPQPEWVQIRSLSGNILYEAESDDFKKLMTNWLKKGSKLVINHIQGHEWWLLVTSWESAAKPIVLIHDRAFLRKSIFDPISGRDLVSVKQQSNNFLSNEAEVWQANWQELINAAEIILTPSKWIQLEMKDAFPEANIIHFPWFDSSDRCELPPVKISTSPTIVGVIGATHVHKGIYDLREASRISLEKNLDIKFVVFGAVPDSFRHLLQAKNIITTGQIQRSRLTRAFGDYGISIIWHCSNVQETFSLALSDNFYSGFPVIAKNGGAYSERIFDRDKSWLYDPQIEIQNLVEFFSSPNGKNLESIYSARENQISIDSSDRDQINSFMQKYGLTEMLWISMLGF